MKKKIIIAGFSGSLRKESYNTMLLRNLKNLLPKGTAFQELSIADIPLYNGDLDLPDTKKRPAAVEKFRQQLKKADAIVIVSPEYNYSIPGVLKNAIDWASRGEDSPLINKPVALMGASQSLWGTTRLQQEFLPLFAYLDMKPVYKPEIYIAEAQDKFDEKGNVKDKVTKELIRKKLEALKKAALQA